MIVTKGDLFASNGRAIGHGVNCKGKMGAGIAVLFKKKYPDMYKEYSELCERGELVPGDCFIWDNGDGTFVYNLASQDYPGKDARLNWLGNAAVKALQHADKNNIKRICLPQIGCGIGGLEWNDVEALLRQVERNHVAQFEIFIL